MSPELMKSRFGADRLRVRPEAPIRHFKPLDTGKDRFGNILFASQDLAYKDKSARYVKAALLVSPQGKEVIQKNRGILQDIELALTQADALRKTNVTTNGEELSTLLGGIQFGDKQKLTFLSYGTYSIVYRLDLQDKSLVIKTPRIPYENGEYTPQPYMNEMLQIQSIKHDLSTPLASLDIMVPTVLFASGLFECAVFETGSEPEISVFGDFVESEKMDVRLALKREGVHVESPTVKNPSLREGKAKEIFDLLTGYIETQQRSDDRDVRDLWSNIRTDIVDYEFVARTDNFIQSSNGTLVLIDPVHYFDDDSY